jgi:hypothetical protein
MTITARPYRDERDLEAMRHLLMSARREAHRAGYLHVGDVVWRLWDTLIAYDLRRVVEVWEGDAGDLIGFACTIRCTPGSTCRSTQGIAAERWKKGCWRGPNGGLADSHARKATPARSTPGTCSKRTPIVSLS